MSEGAVSSTDVYYDPYDLEIDVDPYPVGWEKLPVVTPT
jgi:hypothetical protein